MKIRLLCISLILLTLCFLHAPAAHATPGTPYVQCYNGITGATTTIGCTAGSPNTCAAVGDMVFAFANGYGSGTAITATISDGVNTWSVAASDGTDHYKSYIFKAINSSGSCLTPVVTWSPPSTSIVNELSVGAVSGILSSSPLDCGVANPFTTNAATQSTTGTCAATYTDDLVLSSIVCDSTSHTEFSESAGWTNWDASHTTPTSWRAAYETLSAAGSVTATWNGSNNGPCVYSGGKYGVITVAAFKAADGAPATNGVKHRVIQRPSKYRRTLPWQCDPILFARAVWRKEREL